jgi:hypothetical protein
MAGFFKPFISKSVPPLKWWFAVTRSEEGGTTDPYKHPVDTVRRW